VKSAALISTGVAVAAATGIVVHSAKVATGVAPPALRLSWDQYTNLWEEVGSTTNLLTGPWTTTNLLPLWPTNMAVVKDAPQKFYRIRLAGPAGPVTGFIVITN
jgi:hypothetical protein